MLSFFAGAFALGGLAAALGPVLIHLFTRRRFRVVHWAAMDFLRQAVRRNRRVLRLRDLLLLALRTLCVLLFGLAMARPYLSDSGRSASPDQPVHAVVIVDNTLSMGYEELGRTLLDEAKARAREFIERLGEGSRITVLSLCGSAAGLSREAHRTKEDACDALQAIEVVDRSGSAAAAADLALEALRREPDMPARRVVFVGDQQASNWPAGGSLGALADLPEMQVVQVAPSGFENAWVESFHVEDGIADVETAATLVARVRYLGPGPRPHVQVTLSIDGAAVASETVDLEPGETREVTFLHRFDVLPEAGSTLFVPAAVSLAPPDHLRADDRRVLSVPVVAALPVVFIDQHGEDEDPAKGLHGETFHLRRLLAPAARRGERGLELIEVRQSGIDGLEREVLEDARLAVIAGVERPGSAVPLLREYVAQGGQLIIAAGAEFDPEAWTIDAWLDGDGILPLPLEPQPVGHLSEEAPPDWRPFLLSVPSLVHDYFILDDVDREELADLWGLPLFFKAVAVDASAATLAELAARVRRRESGGEEPRPGEEPPSWLAWRREARAEARGRGVRDLGARVLASFTNGLPYAVERAIGRGDVLFLASGLSPSWSTLVTTNAVLVLDRIVRAKLERTVPERNLTSVDAILLPVDASQRRLRLTLERPGEAEEPLLVDALGPESFGVTIRDVTERGHYLVRARRGGGSAAELEAELWRAPLAVNGPEAESDLRVLDAESFAARVSDTSCRWVAPGEVIRVEGVSLRGQDAWKALMICVLLTLLAELAVLAWPYLGGARPLPIEARDGEAGA